MSALSAYGRWKAMRALVGIPVWLSWLVAAAAIAQPAEPVFTVSTYNVLYLNRNLTKLVATLREARADLVALQETNEESERFLRRELTGDYPHMAFRPGRRSEGFGFLSRAPLRNFKFLEPLPGWRGTWFAEVSLGGTNLQVVSVHLATPKLARGGSLTALADMFQEAEAIHAREIERIVAGCSQQMPVIILGDFNSFSFFRAPKFLADRGWVDSFAAVNANADRTGTWRHRTGEQEWQFRIDYIFHTRDLRTLESRILKSDASDHYPVVSRLRCVAK